MQRINAIIAKKKIVKKESTRKENPLYFEAERIMKELDISLGFAFRIIKMYGLNKVNNLVSWWSDYPNKRDKHEGLLIWKLKEMQNNRRRSRKLRFNL